MLTGTHVGCEADGARVRKELAGKMGVARDVAASCVPCGASLPPDETERERRYLTTSEQDTLVRVSPITP